MTQKQEQLAALQEIRSLMQRSSRFTYLSGWSGIAAGLAALAGVGTIHWYLDRHHKLYAEVCQGNLTREMGVFLMAVALVVFVAAGSSAALLTWLRARKASQSIWQQQAGQLLANLCLPLAVGGVVCLGLLYHHILYLIAPAMLIFYGLALIQGGKYTLPEIRYLGFGELALGLVACFQIDYGLAAWGWGFGGLNIIYGILIYYKYEAEQTHRVVAGKMDL